MDVEDWKNGRMLTGNAWTRQPLPTGWRHEPPGVHRTWSDAKEPRKNRTRFETDPNQAKKRDENDSDPTNDGNGKGPADTRERRVQQLVLLLKIQATKSCAGVSLKTQELYAIVFLTRYLDLFTNFVSLYVEWNRRRGETRKRRRETNAAEQRLTTKLASDATDTCCWISRSYNTIMKLIFIGSALAIIWLMRRHKVVRQSYDKSQDTFRYEFLLAPCFLLSLVLNNMFTVMEVRQARFGSHPERSTRESWQVHVLELRRLTAAVSFNFHPFACSRCFGPFPSTLRPWRSCLRWSCSNAHGM